MNKYKYVITIYLIISVYFILPLYSQESGSDSDETIVEVVTPEEVTPEEVTPEEVTPEEVTPEEVTPEEVTPEEVTPEEVTPEEVTPEEVTPEVVLELDDGDEELIVEEVKKTGRFHFFLDNKMLFAFSVPDGGFGFGETANIQYILPFNLAFGLEGGYYGFRGAIEGDGVSVVAGYTLIPLYATASFNIPIVDNFYITPVLKGGGAYTNARINGWLGGDSFSGIFEGGVRFKAYMRGGLLIHGGIMYTGLIEKSGLFSIMSIGFGFGL